MARKKSDLLFSRILKHSLSAASCETHNINEKYYIVKARLSETYANKKSSAWVDKKITPSNQCIWCCEFLPWHIGSRCIFSRGGGAVSQIA